MAQCNEGRNTCLAVSLSWYSIVKVSLCAVLQEGLDNAAGSRGGRGLAKAGVKVTAVVLCARWPLQH